MDRVESSFEEVGYLIDSGVPLARLNQNRTYRCCPERAGHGCKPCPAQCCF